MRWTDWQIKRQLLSKLLNILFLIKTIKLLVMLVQVNNVDEKITFLLFCHFVLIKHKILKLEGHFFMYLGNITAMFQICKM